MKRKINVNKVKLNKLIMFVIFLFFIVVIARLTYLAMANEIDGINIKEFVSSRNTRKKTVYAKRGTIYSSTNDILAQTINSYTVIAYLDESRSEGYSTPQHVIDKEATAEALSPILNMSEDAILYLLNLDLYQVELGPGGRDITELTKEEIEELNLAGIGFTASYKRYYPYDDFASYILGYVKSTDDGELIGEMGIESYYNDLLNGEDGYTIYQQDANGYKIPNTPTEEKESEDGSDIYLTIDSNIQYFVEKYTESAYETYTPDWMITVVADAKTGAILASTSYPSFDPNELDMTNYLNPLVSYSYEPGSTMKIFTYMAAMEAGVYNGDDTFVSGSVTFGDNTIYDWLTEGFGTITYDEGFLYSSNVGVSYLTSKYFTADKLRSYFEQFGFGSKTGIELPGELAGNLSFTYKLEVANAGFGQGITITPIQMIQAMTILSNNGTMLKPYIVDKIV
ncbi:MAG TPA: penicillin-binding protein 2, partial [Bacilli bacterium]|nr:penicillin-binding protein 2 [Bacilli bacterium]